MNVFVFLLSAAMNDYYLFYELDGWRSIMWAAPAGLSALALIAPQNETTLL